MRRVRVLIVDDHPIVADGLRRALEAHADLQVIASVGSRAEAEPFLDGGKVDVAIVDIRLPDGSGLELVQRATATPGMPPTLVFSSFDTPQYVEAAMRLGASGFLLKTAPMREILAAVRRLADGGTAFAPSLRRSLKRPFPARQLSPRDRDIVERILAGRSNEEIARDLSIARKTVEARLSRMYEQFGLVGRTDLALRAERERWLDLPLEASGS